MQQETILHCMRKQEWDKIRTKDHFGEESIAANGFIHCSSVGHFWRVAPNFASVKEDLVLLLIDPDKLTAKVKWEDPDECGRAYPHVYGPINRDAVVDVLPYVKDQTGRWLKNNKLKSSSDR